MNVAIIGGGAAGCFCAVNLKRLLPSAEVTVYEAGTKTLAKVALTGGGRCNLTNSFESINNLTEAYPRGFRLMQRGLLRFGWKDCCEWFENEGVRLVLQEDNCVFPQSQDAMQIVRCLKNLMCRLGVKVELNHKLKAISCLDQSYLLDFENGNTAKAEKVVVTTGGSPKASGLSFLDNLDLNTLPPVPSLFSLKTDDAVRSLMGTVVQASVSLAGTRFKASGPLLITDWGFSGPAILKLSSYSARYLAERNWQTELLVSWGKAEDLDSLRQYYSEKSSKMLCNSKTADISSRLWEHIIEKAGLRADIRWKEMGKKGMARLESALLSCPYKITGRGRFKDEFVTCGGVDLAEINISTMEARSYPGLFFCGEVLDVDAITGGFNLQAAWTTGYIAAQTIANS